MSAWIRSATVLFVLLGALGACGDDSGTSEQAGELIDEARKEAREAADAVEEAGKSASARAIAEAVRAALVVEDLEGDQNLRDVDVLREAVGDLPGDPQISGIEDSNGDGRDDDGQLEVVVNSERACLSLPDNSGDIDVKNGAC